MAACMALFCPFAWYYLDEARPYAMQLGASLLVVASLARLARDSAMAEARRRGSRWRCFYLASWFCAASA